MSCSHWFDNFEDGNTTGWTVSGASAYNGDAAKGSYCLQCDGDNDYAYRDIGSTVSSLYTRLWWKPTADWTGAYGAAISFYSSAVLTVWLFLYANDNKIYAYNRSTGIATSAAVLTTGWQMFDIYLTIADSGGRLVVDRNGINAIDFTGDTKYSTYTTINRIRLGYQAQFSNIRGWSLFDEVCLSNADIVTTLAPTTLAPTTLAPTTLAPTTLAPTTLAPTTLAPTTLLPSTLLPSTLAPTTLLPTTLAPTTLAPSTAILIGGKLVNKSVLFGRLVQ